MVLDGKSSQKYPVNAGVPQGSILGTTLFLLYINFLDNVICNAAFYAADDTTKQISCVISYFVSWSFCLLFFINFFKFFIYSFIIIFFLHQVIAFQKLWKMFFIASEMLFLFSRYSSFCKFFSSFPHFPDSKGEIVYIG